MTSLLRTVSSAKAVSVQLSNSADIFGDTLVVSFGMWLIELISCNGRRRKTRTYQHIKAKLIDCLHNRCAILRRHHTYRHLENYGDTNKGSSDGTGMLFYFSST